MPKESSMDNYVTFNKIDIAKQQIVTAINLFISENDYISVITLSVAADEILGKIIENKGLSSSYSGISNLMDFIHKDMNREPYSSKEFNNLANGARNHLKHLSGTEVVEFDPKQEACNMLYRAICNYKVLCESGTEEMESWLNGDGVRPAFKIKDA